MELGGPTTNVYTIPFLRSRKIGVGKTFDAAAIEADRRRIPGHVTYFFVRDETFQVAIKAWDETVQAFQEAEQFGQTPVLPEVDTETVMRVLCVAANSQANFQRLAFIRRPICSDISAETREEEIKDKPGKKSLISGKGKVWTAGAANIKKKLNV